MPHKTALFINRHAHLQKLFDRIVNWNWFGLHRRKLFAHLWRFRNIIIALFSLYVVLVLTEMAWFKLFLEFIHSLGYAGILIGGMFFASTFTVSAGLVILTTFAHSTPLWALALVAGIGAAIADLTLFELVKSGIVDELKDLFTLITRRLRLRRLFGDRVLRWMLPVAGALIIASPLPDELGVGMLGFTKIPLFLFVLMTFVLNSLGILSLVVMLV